MFSALAFAVLVRTGVYPPELKSVNLDTDWTYRRFLPKVFVGIRNVVSRLWQINSNFWLRGLSGTITRLYRSHGPEGRMAQVWPTGSMVLWIAILLGVTLIVNFVS